MRRYKPFASFNFFNPFNPLPHLLLATGLLLTCTASLAASKQPSDKAQVTKLVAILKSDAPQKEKADACRELARIGTKEAVAPLAELLADEKLSHMARYALEPIPDSAVDAAFRDALGKLRGRPLVGVIGSIGVRRDPKAVKLLAGLLSNSDPEVVQAAARALGKIGNVAAARALENADLAAGSNQLAWSEGLLRCAETLAADGQRKPAQEIYDRLRGLTLPHQVRMAAWRGAILTRRHDGLPLLVELIRNQDFALFAVGARTAQELPGAEVTRAMAAELPALPPDKQILLIQALGKRADAAALPALLATARQSEPAVRLAALRALPELGQPAAVPVLVDLLGDADQSIAQAAQDGLAALPGPEAEAAVMALLAGSDTNRRLIALELIGRRRMTSALPELFKVAESGDPKVRSVAMRKLGELSDPAQLPAFLDLLARAKSPEDLEAAEQALSAMSTRSANAASSVEKLAARLAQSPPPQKCALLRVLAAFGGAKALETVRAALADPDATVHAAAIRALSGWNSAEAAPDLLRLAETSSDATDKMLCLRGYLRLASQPEVAADKRLAMCRDAAALVQKEQEKKLLLAALGSIYLPGAFDLVQRYLEDTATAQEAGTAAANIAEKLLARSNAAKLAPRLMPSLEKIAQAGNPDLAKRARALLEQARSKSGSK